jgi:CHAD domain-containing protein
LRLIAEPDQAVQAAGLRQRLMTSLGLMPLGEGDALTALAACGVRPLDQSAGMEIRIESPMAAETAAKQILRGLLATLKVNIPGVCRNLDSEFLLDFRVAIRRIRAALSQLRRALSPRVGERLRREFTWLGQLTSNARDLDVFLLAFDDYQRLLPAELREDFAPLRHLLGEIRDREYQVLREALRGERFGRLLRQFRGLLARPLGKRPAARDATRPIGELARERIRDLYQETLDQGSAIAPQSHLDAFHELRKTCKKLRYLMEFFADLFPQEAILALIGALKRLQDNLGEIQDLRVQQEALAIYAHQIQERGTALPRTQEAITWLSAHQGERQRQAREAFPARFAAFASEDNREAFHALLDVGSQEGQTSTC